MKIIQKTKKRADNRVCSFAYTVYNCNNTVSITKNYARLGYEEIIQAPKTPKSKRTITLPAEIMEMVKEYSSMIYDYKPTDRLFITSKQSLTREMIRGCTASGVKRIRIHDLRHPYVKL